MIDPTPEEIEAQWRKVQEAMRKAEEDCDIHITVNGVITPLRDCDWTLKAPCGHVYAIMSAVNLDAVYPDAVSAWHELYAIGDPPHRYRRKREQQIGAMQRRGYTVEAMLRNDAVAEHRRMIKECDNACSSGQGVDTVTPRML